MTTSGDSRAWGPWERSWALLLDWLSPRQLAMIKAENCFEVIGSHSKDTYTIFAMPNGYNIRRQGEERPICFEPDGCSLGLICLGDKLLAQKIMLECDEAAAMSVANIGSIGCGCGTAFVLTGPIVAPVDAS